jgi:nucleotide-binding universal stress UspA family protein
MIKKILVPLDGSKLAECSLGLVKELATSLKVDEVALVTVTHRTQGFRPQEEPGQQAGPMLTSEAVCSIEEQALKYLSAAAKDLENAGVKVQKEVLCGNPAQEILIFIKAQNCDLVVMSSHGGRGPGRWVRGSVAQKVLKDSPVPVMMVRPLSCQI